MSCPVCLEPIGGYYVGPCGHEVCTQCLPFLNGRCAVCRCVLDKDPSEYVFWRFLSPVASWTDRAHLYIASAPPSFSLDLDDPNFLEFFRRAPADLQKKLLSRASLEPATFDPAVWATFRDDLVWAHSLKTIAKQPPDLDSTRWTHQYYGSSGFRSQHFDFETLQECGFALPQNHKPSLIDSKTTATPSEPSAIFTGLDPLWTTVELEDGTRLTLLQLAVYRQDDLCFEFKMPWTPFELEKAAEAQAVVRRHFEHPEGRTDLRLASSEGLDFQQERFRIVRKSLRPTTVAADVQSACITLEFFTNKMLEVESKDTVAARRFKETWILNAWRIMSHRTPFPEVLSALKAKKPTVLWE